MVEGVNRGNAEDPVRFKFAGVFPRNCVKLLKIYIAKEEESRTHSINSFTTSFW